MQNNIAIPHLKPEAIFEIKIGAAFVGNLQETLNFLITDREKEVEELSAKQGDYKDMTPWQTAVVTCITLLQEITKVAGEKGMIEFKTVDQMLASEGINPNIQPEDSSQTE